jgi:hypothetical protein
MMQTLDDGKCAKDIRKTMKNRPESTDFSPLENSRKAILRMPSAESLLALDRLCIGTLVFD